MIPDYAFPDAGTPWGLGGRKVALIINFCFFGIIEIRLEMMSCVQGYPHPD